MMYFLIRLHHALCFLISRQDDSLFWEIFGRKLLWHLVQDFADSSKYVPWNALSICMPDDLINLFINIHSLQVTWIEESKRIITVTSKRLCRHGWMYFTHVKNVYERIH